MRTDLNKLLFDGLYMLTLTTDYIGVIVATIVAMIVGFIWYLPQLFGTMWAKELGKDLKRMQKEMGKAMGAGFISALITAFMLSTFIRSLYATPTIMQGLAVGLAIWFGFFATMEMILMAFEGRSMRLFLIGVSHHLAVLIVVSIVLVLI